MKKIDTNRINNKDGFTLVELLSIIIVLSLILVIVAFVGTSIINNARNNSYEVTINNIENVASSYVNENQIHISWVNRDDTDKEYVCIIVQELIDTGYFKSDVLDSYIDKNVKVNSDDFVYLERDSKTKTLEKEILLSKDIDQFSDYFTFCEDVDKNGIINIKYEPIGWSKSKNIFIDYRLMNNIDYLSGYTYGYKYNENELVDIDNEFNSFIEKQNLTVNKNGTIYAEISSRGSVKVSKSLDITTIDNEGPIVAMGNYKGGNSVNRMVVIPIVITDMGSGFDSNSFTINDIVVSIGGKIINDGLNLIKVDDNNYNLQINNNIDSGLIKFKIDENKVFDKLENPNGKFEINTGIRFNNVYTVSYDANGGTGAPSNQTKKHGVSLVLSSTIPINLGYTFLGWSTSPSATSAIYQSGANYTANSDVILYAVWKKSEINPISSYWCANGSVGSSPYDLVYTGNCTVHNDGSGDWRIKFLTSGNLKVSATAYIDAFLVGGGGGGGSSVYKTAHYGERSHEGGGGGGGGYITSSNSSIEILANTGYQIIIGAGGGSGGAGGASSAFGLTANGGKAGSNGTGGAGGSGGGAGAGWHDANAGNGGANGGSGVGNDYYRGGTGQGTVMSEFGSYGGGGGGGNSYWVERDGSERWYTSNGIGGTGGGGNGGYKSVGLNGANNTGGGGGGGGASSSKRYSGGAGGSGIVIIRNFRVGCEIGDKIIPNFEYTGFCESINDGNGNWRIKFLTSGILTLTSSFDIDAFLVGGGGGGGNSVHKAAHDGEESYEGGGGGGGGYITSSNSSIKISANNGYRIIVGEGGGSSSAGGASSAFGLTANGGKAGSNGIGGAGGSGGGAGGGWHDANAGNGGANGGTGGRNSYYNGGTGQGATTSEFGQTGATLYGGGGGGGNSYWDDDPDDGFEGLYTSSGKGGAGGGGNGGNNSAGSFGTNNTGGGGGGGSSRSFGGSGGSGIVIIRNKR